MNEAFIKIFLFLYFLLYYSVLFVLNTILVAKKIGKNPYVLTKGKGVVIVKLQMKMEFPKLRIE